MKLIFICKASTEIGFGHLIRSRSLANSLSLHKPDVSITFFAIGDISLKQLLNNTSYPVHIIKSEQDLVFTGNCDVAVLDMLTIGDKALNEIRSGSKLLVSLSPVFNHFTAIDILFHRTKYFHSQQECHPKNIYSGLEYTIIQEHCQKISTAQYERKLQHEYFPVAISMGGGDAANLTLDCLKELKKCNVPATFWVLLGEGYKFSYDELVKEIRKDSNHEILLIKTNQSMWHILENCILMIIPGGVTAYEAAFAGMPTIIYNKNASSSFLMKELHEEKVAMNYRTWPAIRKKIESLYSKKKDLLLMHIRSKNLIEGKAYEKIYDKLSFHLDQIDRNHA